MRSEGVFRIIGENNRIVLPKSLVARFGWGPGTELEIFTGVDWGREFIAFSRSEAARSGAINLSSGNYYKILEISGNDEDFLIVKGEKPNADTVREWAQSFAESGMVAEEDKEKFLEFFEDDYLEEHSLVYNRMVDGEFRKVLMRIREHGDDYLLTVEARE